MEIQTESTEVLRWDINGIKAEARIESQNSAHTFKGFDTTGSVEGRSTFIVTVDKEDDLKELYKALGELIQHLDKKRSIGRFITIDDLQQDIGKIPVYKDHFAYDPALKYKADILKLNENTHTDDQTTSGHDSIK